MFLDIVRTTFFRFLERYRKWLREKQRGWQGRLAINGIGALLSFAVLVIFCITKFIQGAWIVIVLTPLLLWFITAIHDHYEDVAKQLKIPLDEPLPHRESIVIIPIAGIHRVVASTIAYAKTLTPNVIAFYISFTEEEEDAIQAKWEQWNPGVRLVVFRSRYRTIVKPLVDFIERIDTHIGEKQTIMVLLPQFVPAKWWHRLLHNQSAHRIRDRLLKEKDIVVATVPYHLSE